MKKSNKEENMARSFILLLAMQLVYVMKTRGTVFDVDLEMSLLPNENEFDIRMTCTATSTEYTDRVESVTFYNSRKPAFKRTTRCSHLNGPDPHRCARMLKTAFGESSWANCTVSRSNNCTAVVKLAHVVEEDLSTWTCLADFLDAEGQITRYEHGDESSSVYHQAAITAFPDRYALNVLDLKVVGIEMTTSGHLYIGCSMTGLNEVLHVHNCNTQGVPLKNIQFTINGNVYSGDLYERTISYESARCEDKFGEADQSVVCFNDRKGIAAEPEACNHPTHSYTLLAENAVRRNPFTFEPKDTSPFFLFPSATHPGYQVNLGKYLVFENPPRSVGCYAIAGRSNKHVCFTPTFSSSVLRKLIDSAANYKRLRVSPVNNHVLTCPRGRVVSLIAKSCILGKTDTCDANAGFEIVSEAENVTIDIHYIVKGCAISHYYCFDRPRLDKRNVNIVMVSRNTERRLANVESKTSDDIVPDCTIAHNLVSSSQIYEAYNKTLMHFLNVSAMRNTSITFEEVTNPILACPCRQTPRTCPSSFPVLATLKLNSTTLVPNSDMSCSVFGKRSPVVHTSQVLEETLCRSSHRSTYRHTLDTLVPVLRKENIRVGRKNMHYDILECSSKSICSNVNETTVHDNFTHITFFPRRWVRPNRPRIYHVTNHVVVNPAFFMLKYRSVRCDNDSFRKKKGKTFNTYQLVNDYLKEMHCKTSTYEMDVRMIDNSTVECVAAYVGPMPGLCPKISRLTLMHTSCYKNECHRVGMGSDMFVRKTVDSSLEASNNFTVRCTAYLDSTLNINGNSDRMEVSTSMYRLKKEKNKCNLTRAVPNIVQRTSLTGHTYVTCKYPLSVGSLENCPTGIEKAVLELHASKRGHTARSLIFPSKKHHQLVNPDHTWVTYTLDENSNTALVTSKGKFAEHVEGIGYSTPSRNVVAVKVSRNYISHITDFGNDAVMIYAQCTFVHEDKPSTSQEIVLPFASLGDYRHQHGVGTMSSILYRNRINANNVYPKTTAQSTRQLKEHHFILSICLSFIVVSAVITTVAVSICVAPKYRYIR